jgi:ankyrin repeat protein
MSGRLAIFRLITLVLVQAFVTRSVSAGELCSDNAISRGLIVAIRSSDIPAVETLIDNGANVNSRDAEGNTPLILASLYASPKCVELLLEKHADPNASNNAGVTALSRAATCYEKTRLLLKSGARVRVQTARLGNTPLILASRHAGNSPTVKLLLEAGAYVGRTNNAGVSPIMAAAASGDFEIVQLLLNAGGNPDDFPKSDQPRATELMSGFRTPLMWAAYRNDVAMVRLLLERGADPNKSTFFGTPLSHACWNDGFEAAELLLRNGADVNARDAVAGYTPLHWAAGNESFSPHLVKLLLASGADPSARGGESVGAYGLAPQTPRLIAQKRGQTPIVQALIEAGAKEEPYPERAITPHRKLPARLEDSTLIATAESALEAL